MRLFRVRKPGHWVRPVSFSPIFKTFRPWHSFQMKINSHSQAAFLILKMQLEDLDASRSFAQKFDNLFKMIPVDKILKFSSSLKVRRSPDPGQDKGRGKRWAVLLLKLF